MIARFGGQILHLSRDRHLPPGTTHQRPALYIPEPQYFGTRGSTLSLQARMPPCIFLTFLKPACLRKSTALALRMPLLQWATISSAEFSSLTRLGSSPRGISFAYGMCAI